MLEAYDLLFVECYNYLDRLLNKEEVNEELVEFLNLLLLKEVRVLLVLFLVLGYLNSLSKSLSSSISLSQLWILLCIDCEV